MTNPFAKEKQKCILCKHRITPNYKNVRLLSQFVSRFTGKIYSRNITGLCEKQQLAVQFAINRAINAGKSARIPSLHYPFVYISSYSSFLYNFTGLMAGYYRDPRFAHDPKLFDPDNPFRPHRY
jgi:ribosomal protein S18